MKQQVTFLKSGEVTWVSKSGKSQDRQYVSKGTEMSLKVESDYGGNVELWDGNWSIIMPANNIKVGK